MASYTLYMCLLVLSVGVSQVVSMCRKSFSIEPPYVESMYCDRSNLISVNNQSYKDTITKLTLVHFEDKQIKFEAFQYPNLLSLSIIDSNFDMIHHLAFSNLDWLAELRIEGNHLPMKTFDGLEMLETLTLKNNSIGALHPKMFRNMRALKKLDLSHNEIESVEFCMMQYTLCAESIDLSFNHIKNLIACSLKLNLKMVSLNRNDLKEIKRDSFKDFWLLRELHLSSNKIRHIDENAFEDNRLLRVLDLSDNRIVSIPPRTFRNLNLLKTLDLSMNQIRDISDGLFGNLGALEYLSIISNCIDKFDDLKYLTNLRRLHAKNLPDRKVTPHLIELKLANRLDCDTSKELRTGDLFGMEILHNITVYRKSILLTHERFERISVRHLEMKRCGLTELPRFMFKAMYELEHLDLSMNELRVLGNDLFVSQKTLRSLILRDCSLSLLSPVILKPLISLEYLNIENNKLESLEFDTFRLPSLRTVLLGRNLIKSLPDDLLKDGCYVENFDVKSNLIENIHRGFFKGTFLKTFEYDSNPIYCDCLWSIEDEINAEKIRTAEMFSRSTCVNSWTAECTPQHSKFNSGANSKDIYSFVTVFGLLHIILESMHN